MYVEAPIEWHMICLLNQRAESLLGDATAHVGYDFCMYSTSVLCMYTRLVASGAVHHTTPTCSHMASSTQSIPPTLSGSSGLWSRL